MTSGNDFSDKCDNTWTPIENLEAALVGYDLPSGNPFASDFIEDPGLKKQIFNATIPSENEDENYKLDSGISIREYEMCDDHFKIRLATSIKGYKKVIRFLFEFPIKIENKCPDQLNLTSRNIIMEKKIVIINYISCMIFEKISSIKYVYIQFVADRNITSMNIE